MKTLKYKIEVLRLTANEYNFNFKTIENSIKTIGSILLLISFSILILNEIINPSIFQL